MDSNPSTRVYTGSDYLHGSAVAHFRGERKNNPSLPADHSQTVVRKPKKQRGRRFRKLVSKCFPCLKRSDSYSCEESSSTGNDGSEQISVIHECTQDHEKYAHFRFLIANTGRSTCYKDLVSAKDINVTVRNANLETAVKCESSRMIKSEEAVCWETRECLVNAEEKKPPSCRSHHQPGELSPDNLPGRCEGQGGTRQSERDSEELSASSWAGEDYEASTERKTVERNQHDTGGCLAEGVKMAVKAVLSGQNQVSGQENHLIPRRSVRDRSEYFKSTQKTRGTHLKYLLDFRYSLAYRQNQQITQMMDSPSGFCHPRYSEISARNATLRDCTDVQLSGYTQEELAHAGWFFSGHILTTFCCGVKMPCSSNGRPLSVHLGLSPQCQFAVTTDSQHNSATESGGETQRKDQPQGDGQASGKEADFHFSTPVQCSATDDGPAEPVFVHFPPISYHQESHPSDHRVIDGAGVTGSHTSDASYHESLVTNRTELAAEQQPSIANRPQPAVLPRPEGSGQNSQPQPRTQGQLYMRGNVQIPMIGSHLPMAEHVGRQSPPPTDYVPHIDQLNLIDSGSADYVPCYVHFGHPGIRLHTFKTWPTDRSQSPSSLADAGFFYAGYGDSVLCYLCGIGARHWLPTDHPWIEHARLRPSCVFVKTLQGQHFIDVAREMTRNSRQPTYQEVRLEANRRQQASETAEDSDAAGAILGDDDTTVELLCKICYQRERSIMLLPCRHLAVCEPCGVLYLSCPVCHAAVETTLRTALAD